MSSSFCFNCISTFNRICFICFQILSFYPTDLFIFKHMGQITDCICPSKRCILQCLLYISVRLNWFIKVSTALNCYNQYHHRQRGIKRKCFKSRECGMFKIKVSADLIYCKAPVFYTSQTAVFLSHPHMIENDNSACLLLHKGKCPLIFSASHLPVGHQL